MRGLRVIVDPVPLAEVVALGRTVCQRARAATRPRWKLSYFDVLPAVTDFVADMWTGSSIRVEYEVFAPRMLIVDEITKLKLPAHEPPRIAVSGFGYVATWCSPHSLRTSCFPTANSLPSTHHRSSFRPT